MPVTIGREIKLYQLALGTSTTPTNLAGLTGIKDANQITGVTDIGAAELTRDVSEYSVFGKPRVQKIAAQINSGDFTFDLAYDPSNAKHVALLGAPGSAGSVSPTTFGFADGTNAVWVKGLVTSASLTPSTDTQTTLSVTVTVTDGPGRL